jgi:hypothetical protein
MYVHAPRVFCCYFETLASERHIIISVPAFPLCDRQNFSQCPLGGFIVSNLMEIKRRMKDIGKKITV